MSFQSAFFGGAEAQTAQADRQVISDLISRQIKAIDEAVAATQHAYRNSAPGSVCDQHITIVELSTQMAEGLRTLLLCEQARMKTNMAWHAAPMYISSFSLLIAVAALCYKALGGH